MNFILQSLGNIDFENEKISISNTSEDMKAGSNTGGFGSLTILGNSFKWDSRVVNADTALPANVVWKDHKVPFVGLIRCVDFKHTGSVEIETTFTIGFKYSFDVVGFGEFGADGDKGHIGSSVGWARGRVRACALCIGDEEWLPIETSGAKLIQ